MHAVGLHSALAIKRQRKRRDEQRRARDRRYSIQSGESILTSTRASTGSLESYPRYPKTTSTYHAAGQGGLDSKVVTSIGMLHVGVVFLVLGAFLFMSGILPGNLVTWGTKVSSTQWWNELVATGIFAIFIGMFLIIINRIIAKKEENDLEKYVQHQLTRSKSGHKLERDVETGGLTTKHARLMKELMDTSSTCMMAKDEKIAKSPEMSLSHDYSSNPVSDCDQIMDQTIVYLEQIAEEDVTDKVESSIIDTFTLGLPNDTREIF